jgi:hypothetical protein
MVNIANPLHLKLSREGREPLENIVTIKDGHVNGYLGSTHEHAKVLGLLLKVRQDELLWLYEFPVKESEGYLLPMRKIGDIFEGDSFLCKIPPIRTDVSTGNLIRLMEGTQGIYTGQSWATITPHYWYNKQNNYAKVPRQSRLLSVQG